eukprot:TRINITY_DN50270_c0_g1_i2.p1 TRINITY_DN50270_c0_g1~~TRINITY_DN50270_c0_g1_i2.p1  ORF type:complete len:394 (+),score=71.81 TRINITY_DN50270_c0_g1_i2:95-1276(+)
MCIRDSPYAVSELGWGCGFGLMVLSALGAVYSGVTLNEVIQHIPVVPRQYSQLGLAAFGEPGRAVVRSVQFGFLGGCIVAVQLTASESLVKVVEACGGSLCVVVAHLIIAGFILPVMQFQSLGNLGRSLSIPGVLSILIPLIMILVKLAGDGTTGTTAFQADSSFKQTAQAATAIAFAYQGQTIFPELRAEMRQPAEFPKAVAASAVIMTLVYGSVTATGYHYMGDQSVDNMMKVLTSGPQKALANALLILHVLVGYIINGNVMNHEVTARLSACLGSSHAPAGPTRALWLCATSITVGISFVLANIIPNLSVILGLVGATFGYTLSFVFPALFWFQLVLPAEAKKSKQRMWHGLVLVLAVGAIGLGSYAEVSKLVDVFKLSLKSPFGCSDAS